jgi:hypothetical protein
MMMRNIDHVRQQLQIQLAILWSGVQDLSWTPKYRSHAGQRKISAILRYLLR